MNDCINEFLTNNKYYTYSKYNLNSIIIQEGDYNNGQFYSFIKEWFIIMIQILIFLMKMKFQRPLLKGEFLLHRIYMKNVKNL